MLDQLRSDKFMEDIVRLQSTFLRSKTMDERKKLAQFFTGQKVSEYMASLLGAPMSDSVRILDAGAGTGILTVSAALRCLDLGCSSVYAVLYELDSEAIPNLTSTLRIVQEAFEHVDKCFGFEIRCEDFVLSRPDKDQSIEPFDISVINPPYFKYSSTTSPYAKATSDLYRGDPNIYASFLAVVMASLKCGGELVAITPRSFTNGLYFKGFRRYLLNESSLNLIHIFKRRDKVFKNYDSSVLQESIICGFIKGGEQHAVAVRSSDCDVNILDSVQESYPSKLVIDPSNDQQIIRIPESANDARVLRQAESLTTTFTDAGYFISTGRVVEHRTRQFITDEIDTANSVPLYRPHNITPLTAVWTGNHPKDRAFLLDAGHEKHTMKNENYVLLKRFSSKDERRRLVAGVYISELQDSNFIGFGNKTNYLGVSGGKLSEVEAYGIAAIFNSTFMDKYFRCISGNTQVNATEIRVMKFPNREEVIKVGTEVENINVTELSKLDVIVNSILGVDDATYTE
jgi:adenine-specific DNA-methyltransferase